MKSGLREHWWVYFQALDGKFADGATESKDKFNTKDGGRSDAARPRTNMQVRFSR